MNRNRRSRKKNRFYSALVAMLMVVALAGSTVSTGMAAEISNDADAGQPTAYTSANVEAGSGDDPIEEYAEEQDQSAGESDYYDSGAGLDDGELTDGIESGETSGEGSVRPEEEQSETAASEYKFVAEYQGGAYQVGSGDLNVEDFTVSVYDADGNLADTLKAESVSSDYEVDEDGYILALVMCIYGGESVTVETKIAAIKTLAGEEAFAVYSATDNSFTFYCGEVPETGTDYNGKTVTTVYTGMEDAPDEERGEVSPYKDVAESVKSVTFDESFASAQPVDTSYWFYGFKYCTEFNGLSNLNTSEVTSIDSMFESCEVVKSLDVSSWDVSNVTAMRGVFALCYKLSDLNVSGWDVSSVTKMNNLFHDCNNLTSIDVSGWDTSSVISMSGLFQGSGIDSMDITRWDTSSVQTMSKMFSGCENLTSLSISGIDTSSVTDMSKMFEECKSLEGLDIRGFNTTNVETFERFAYDCESLQWITIGDNFDLFARSTLAAQMVSTQNWYDDSGNLVSDNYLVEFQGGAGTYYTSENVEDNSNVFAVYSETDHSLTFYQDDNGRPEKGDIYNEKEVTEVYAHFETQRYTDEYVPWHWQREFIHSVVVDESFKDVEPFSTAYWFYDFEYCTSFDLTYLDTSQETEMEDMFSGCKSVTELDLSSFDTSGVTSMESMFEDCNSLTSLNMEGWDTSSVTTMNQMFKHCYAMTTIDVSELDTQNVENMGQMFRADTGLIELDLSTFDTSSLQVMANMVNGCTNLETINLRGWVTDNVTGMASEFRECPNLKTIYAYEDDFHTDHEENDSNMFLYDYSLIGQNGTTYDEDKIHHDMAHVDVADNPGYFTDRMMFAVYCADDGSLTFYADRDVPAAGDSYGGKAATEVYLYAVNTGEEEPPWEDVKANIATVSCDESIEDFQPKSFYNWFSDMTNCTSVDLTYLDTTTATVYDDMMTGMDALESLTIGDDFDLFVRSSDALVSQQYWYDEAGDPLSSNFMKDIDTAGTYYTNTSALYNGDGTFKVVLVWDDEANNDGIRPQEVLVKLTRDNATVDGVEMTLTGDETDEDGNWTGTFTGLPKYVNGSEVTYSVKEDVTSGYTYRIELLTDEEGKAYVQLTNVHVSVKEDIEVTKVWNDADNQDGKRPDSITVSLLVNGSLYKESTLTAETEGVTVSEGGNVWKYTMSEIPVDKNGEAIEYTMLEVDVENYGTPVIETIRGDEITDNGVTYQPYSFVVTNSHTPEQITVSGTKVWDDAGNQDGKRPQYVRLNLSANGEVVDSIDVSTDDAEEDNENVWAWAFSEHDKYKDGVEIKYTVTEEEVTGYTTEITGSAEDGFIITNSYEPETTTISGNKTWEDDNDAQHMRPENITIRLHANGSEVVATQIVGESDGWAWEFDDLPVYEDGHEIHYTITEDAVENYVTVYDGYNVTNTLHEGETSVTVVKDWEDNDDQDGLRSERIEVGLWADGGKTSDTLILNEENGWEGTFEEISENASGVKIVYTVEEIDEISGYTSTITGNAEEGFVITNSHDPEQIDLSGSKVWEDNGDQDGICPDHVTIHLLADGEALKSKTVTAADNWTWTFEDLDKYAAGTEIEYTMEEVFVADGYDVDPGNADNNFTFTNTHEPEKIDITGTKTWDDDNDRDGIRPSSITVSLLAGDETVDSQTVTENDGWTYTFSGLNKCADGEEIDYSIREDEPEGYKASYTYFGYDVTNTHSPELFNGDGTLGVIMHWDDEDDQDGLRPERTTITLMINGVPDETITLVLSGDNTDENGSWIGTFEDLYKYADGEKIGYNVEESDMNGYTCTAELKFDEDTGLYYIEITNTHEPETINSNTHVLAVTLRWNDDDNADGLRPESVTLTLRANGDPVLDANGEPVTLVLDGSSLDEDGNWTGEFDLNGIDLYRYKDGLEISYTVGETDDNDEDLSADGYISRTSLIYDTETGTWYLEVTNSHTTVTQDITVIKKWDDASDQDGKRPDSIRIHLKANDGTIEGGDVTLTKDDVTITDDGNTWTYVFEEMPVDENGTPIEYTLTEDEVSDYESDVQTEMGDEITDSGVTYEPYTFTVTNSHEPENASQGGSGSGGSGNGKGGTVGNGGSGSSSSGDQGGTNGNGSKTTRIRNGRTGDTNMVPILSIIIIIAAAAIVVLLVVRQTGKRNRRIL